MDTKNETKEKKLPKHIGKDDLPHCFVFEPNGKIYRVSHTRHNGLIMTRVEST